jgi:hypothetical protein
VCLAYKTNDQKTRLIIGSSLDFQQIRVFPEGLGIQKVDPVLLQIGLAFIVIVLESAHEYKIFLFYSLGKIGGESGEAANAALSGVAKAARLFRFAKGVTL